MNRSIITTMALGAALLSSGAIFAATPSIPTTPAAVPSAHVKQVHFDLRNDTAQTIKLQAGARELTVQPGKTMSVKLPIGTDLVAEAATPNRAAGTVLVQVADSLGDTTVVLK